MSASTAKKVLVDRYDRSLLRGYVQPQSYRTPDGLELMSPDGSLTIVPYLQIKCVSFVRDLDGSERPGFAPRVPGPAQVCSACGSNFNFATGTPSRR